MLNKFHTICKDFKCIFVNANAQEVKKYQSVETICLQSLLQSFKSKVFHIMTPQNISHKFQCIPVYVQYHLIEKNGIVWWVYDKQKKTHHIDAIIH